MNNPDQNSSKTMLITGAAGGIGKACVRVFSETGWRVIAVDRAGLVGEDGTSHQGMFTLTAQRQLPNLVIASPKDEQELRSLLQARAA